jgi:acetylornithine deacetylase
MTSDRPTTTQLLDRLVAFDTTSRHSNLPLMAFVRELLEANGVRFQESRDPSGRKANLHAIIGPPVAGGIALSGHVDTVPVDGQRWAGDPFRLRADDGRLFGRGTCDMKGFVASMLAAVPDLVAMRLARPIHLFITFDEETTMDGARLLIAGLRDGDGAGWPPPAMCVVGEPSLMQPIVGHKGRLAARAVVRGSPAHSADPRRGVNAIHAAAQAIGWIAAEAARLSVEGPFAAGFEPPFTTSQVGTIEGGTALNIVPERCEFTVEWRPVPGDDPRAALARLERHMTDTVGAAMWATNPGCGIGFEVTDWVPGMSLPADHALAALTRRAAGSNGAGHVSYATEGGLYQEAGIPTIVCGPGSIDQAHGADEWIAASQLDACDGFLRRLAQHVAA